MSKVIQFNKLKLVSGLEWHPVDLKRKSIQKLSNEFNSDFYATFGRNVDGVQDQVGFCQDSEFVYKNHFSLAVLVLSQLNETDAIVVIQFDDDELAMVVIDNGLITHDLFGNNDEVQKEFLNLAAYKDFAVKYTPKTWSDSDSDQYLHVAEFDFDLSLAKKHKSKARLKPVSISFFKYLIPVALILSSVYALNQWIVYQEDQKHAAMLAEIERLKAMENKSVERVVYPWNESYSALNTWIACDSLLMPLDLYPAGWKSTATGCNDSGATITFMRESNGNVSGLIESYPNAEIDLSGNGAVINVPHSLKSSQLQIPIDALPAYNDTKNRLLSLSQSYLFSLTMTPLVAKSLPGQQQKSQKPFKQLTITIQSELLSVKNVLSLINLPTLVDATFSSTEPGRWKIQGVLYVK